MSQHVTKSLDRLGLEEASYAISLIQFPGSKKSLTFRELAAECSRPVYRLIARQNNLDTDLDAHISQIVSEKRSAVKGPVHLARNFYIYTKVRTYFALKER